MAMNYKVIIMKKMQHHSDLAAKYKAEYDATDILDIATRSRAWVSYRAEVSAYMALQSVLDDAEV